MSPLGLLAALALHAALAQDPAALAQDPAALAQDPAALAQDPALLSTPGLEQLAFAEHLRRQGALHPAALEFQRAAFTLGQHPAGQRAALGAAEAYMAAGDWEQAARQLHPLPGAQARLGEAEALYQLGRYADAAGALDAAKDPALADLRAYRSGWLALRQGQPEAALAAWSGVNDPALAPSAAALAGTVAAWEPLRLPSPALAGLLSAALPGAGQLYAGEPRDAASALLINGALIGGTAFLARQERWPGTAALGLVALSFYAGNITSATHAARRTAARREAARLAELEGWELHLDLAEQGAAWAPRVGPP